MIADATDARRILIIDDTEAIHADFRKILQLAARPNEVGEQELALFGAAQSPPAVTAFEVDSAFQGREGYEKVVRSLSAGKPYQVAFVDMRMPPGWDGVQTIQKLWEADPRLQVVICSAYSEYSFERIVTSLGVTDRLLILKKPFDPLEVSQIAAALTAKWHSAAQAALKLAEMEKLVQLRTSELKQAALIDKLTGLPNRELLNDRLDQLIQHSRRDAQRKFAVLFLDFDRFKLVNDSLGHRNGDLLLIAIAERLRSEIRDTDSIACMGTAARLGGDEFVVLLDELRDYHDAARVTERLLEALNKPYVVGGSVVHSTASVGLTTSALNYTKADDMIRDADTAMYRAKAGGRARYMLFDQQMHEDAVGRLMLENDLRQSIEHNELIVHYQPIINLANGDTVGFEALVRWQHPRRGLVPPNLFIPLAEEIGFIVPLGEWVLGAACRQLADWRRRFPEFKDIGVSVNLSRKQLGKADLVDTVAKVLRDTGLPSSCLTLELTESAIMENPDDALRVLERIRGLNVELHLDDFGTGYSSLSCLHRFPISGLKIDRAFVKELPARGDVAVLTKAIINLSHDMGIRVVAEGLELQTQRDFLRTVGCDFGQGFGISRPVAATAAETYLLSARSLAKSA